MKNISILLLVTFTTALLSCSKTNLEEIARERVEIVAEKAQPSLLFSHTVRNVKTVFSGDSVCTIQYELYINEHKSSRMMEYTVFYTLANPTLYGVTYPVENGKNDIMTASKLFIGKDMSQEDIERSLRLSAGIFFQGREGKTVDLDIGK